MFRLLPLLLALAGPAAAAPGTPTAVGVGLTGAGLAVSATGITVLLTVPGVRILKLDDGLHWTTYRSGNALMLTGSGLSVVGSGLASWGANHRRGAVGAPKGWGVVAWTLFAVGAPTAFLVPVVGAPVLALSTTAACLQGHVNRRHPVTILPAFGPGATGVAVAGRF